MGEYWWVGEYWWAGESLVSVGVCGSGLGWVG